MQLTPFVIINYFEFLTRISLPLLFSLSYFLLILLLLLVSSFVDEIKLRYNPKFYYYYTHIHTHACASVYEVTISVYVYIYIIGSVSLFTCLLRTPNLQC